MLLEERTAKRLGEDVGKVVSGRDTFDNDILSLHLLTNEMVADVDMLDVHMKGLIKRECNSAIVVAEKSGSLAGKVTLSVDRSSTLRKKI
jgi:hypothetical protein